MICHGKLFIFSLIWVNIKWQLSEMFPNYSPYWYPGTSNFTFAFDKSVMELCRSPVEGNVFETWHLETGCTVFWNLFQGKSIFFSCALPRVFTTFLNLTFLNTFTTQQYQLSAWHFLHSLRESCKVKFRVQTVQACLFTRPVLPNIGNESSRWVISTWKQSPRGLTSS